MAGLACQPVTASATAAINQREAFRLLVSPVVIVPIVLQLIFVFSDRDSISRSCRGSSP
jgi:hypothetical protein